MVVVVLVLGVVGGGLVVGGDVVCMCGEEVGELTLCP